MDVVCETAAEGVALVTLNRPQAMNAMSSALRSALCDAMERIREDDSVRAVVLTGAGERAFTAGLDLKELGAAADNLGAANDPDPRSNPVRAVERCGKPVIGALNGVAVTGGFELALACDILIASTNARFADTHVLVGLLPGWGLSAKLSRIIGVSRAKEMSLSGRFISAETAVQWGLVNRVVAPADLLREAIALAADIAAVDPKVTNAYRTLIDDNYGKTFRKALRNEHKISSEFNGEVSAADIESRRAGVQSRGRKQL